MIKINLAKPLKIGASTGAMNSMGVENVDVQDVQKQGGFKLLFVLLFPVAIYIYESQAVPELKRSLMDKQKKLNMLTEKNEKAKTAVEETKKFSEDQERLQKQIQTLDGLRKERMREVKILDNIQKDIPEKVWINAIKFEDKRLLISGLAVSDPDLTNFMENMSRSVFLRDVNLIKSDEQMMENSSKIIKKFDVTASLEEALPSSEVKTK